MDAAPISEKDIMTNNIKKECQIILEKYLENREYSKEKVENWKNYTLKELNDFLEKNYINFGFVFSIMIMKRGNARTDSRTLYRNKTDNVFHVSIESKTMYSEIRIFFFKLYNYNKSLVDSINEEIALEMNNILSKNLEGKRYSYEIAKDSTSNITEELNNYLVKQNFGEKCCSSSICYTIEKPIEFKFNFKIVRLKYFPLMASYANESLYSLLILILMEN